MSLEILYEDNHLLVVAKPAGLLVQGDATSDPSLLDLGKDHRRKAGRKPGGVYLGLVHRLDRPVSGVVVLACTSKAAARLSQQFREGSATKTYLAVTQAPGPRPLEDQDTVASGLWEDFLLKDRSANRTICLSTSRQGARFACTRWRRLSATRTLLLLELSPLTGRSHQLRAQCAHRGMPIYGDHKYGSRHHLHSGIALHAHALEIDHPTRHVPLHFTCPPPPTWRCFPFPPTLLWADSASP